MLQRGATDCRTPADRQPRETHGLRQVDRGNDEGRRRLAVRQDDEELHGEALVSDARFRCRDDTLPGGSFDATMLAPGCGGALMPSMIGRRNFLASAGAVVAAGVTGAALAEAADEPAGKSGGPHGGLVDAARACVADGQACLAHCLEMFKNGDTSLAACAQSLAPMLPACSAGGPAGS